MLVLEGLVHGLIRIPIQNLIPLHPLGGPGQAGKLATEVLALLVGALGGRRQRGQLGVDLAQQLVQLGEVEGAALVAIVLLEKAVEPLKVVRGLGEALLDASGHVAPHAVRQLQLRRVAAFLPRQRAQEAHDVVGHVVLDGGAVADGVDVAEGRAGDAQVRVGFEGVPVVLAFQLLREALAEVGLC